MTSKTSLASVALAAGLALASAPAQAAVNLVLNPDFDLDSPAAGVAPLDWTLTTAATGSNFFVGADTPAPFSAPNSANFGATAGDDDVLSQVLPTIVGHMYRISFELAHNQTDLANDFAAQFDGTQILSLVNATASGYIPFSFVANATAAATTLSFAGRENAGAYLLDNVSVVDLSAAPEPAAWALMLSGVFGAGLMLRGRRARVAA